MSDLYTTRTANLRATKGDFSKIDAKQIILNGKNILDYISDSEFDSYDTRDPQLKNDELDVWNTAISLSDNGHIEVKPNEHSVELTFDSSKGQFIHTYKGITESQANTIKTAVKVVDNEVLGANDEHIMYWQTDGLTDGYKMFNNCTNLTSFSSDLSSLTDGEGMFKDCSNLTSFTSDLSSLTNGSQMFYNCSNLTSFTSDLSSLTNGYGMFGMCGLTSFSSDLSNLTEGRMMFMVCINLTSFNSDLSKLTNGYSMFNNCTNLTSFNSNLSSLTNGTNMFYNCKLDAPSIANIVHTLPTHETNGTISIGIGCNNTAEDQLLFAQECDCETWQELLDDFSAKNWTVTLQCNGSVASLLAVMLKTLPISASCAISSCNSSAPVLLPSASVYS